MAPKHKKKAGHKKRDGKSKTPELKAESKLREFKADKADKVFKSTTDGVLPPLIDEES